MVSAILLNRKVADRGGMPEFEYDGDFVLVDDGSVSGEWIYAFTTSGTLTLTKKIAKATVKAQGGGGGGGASNGSVVGSDGEDGTIETLFAVKLDVGEYAISLGAAGARGYGSAGYAGGDTLFGNLLTADGGAGGARAGGNRNQEHTSIYSSYGEGGLGGTTSQYSGSYSTTVTTTLNLSSGYTYIRTSADHNASTNGTISVRTTIRLASTTKYACSRGDSGCYFYKLYDGRGYIDAGDCKTPTTTVNDTRKWYGVAGNGGVVLLSGKA